MAAPFKATASKSASLLNNLPFALRYSIETQLEQQQLNQQQLGQQQQGQQQQGQQQQGQQQQGQQQQQPYRKQRSKSEHFVYQHQRQQLQKQQKQQQLLLQQQQFYSIVGSLKGLSGEPKGVYYYGQQGFQHNKSSALASTTATKIPLVVKTAATATVPTLSTDISKTTVKKRASNAENIVKFTINSPPSEEINMSYHMDPNHPNKIPKRSKDYYYKNSIHASGNLTQFDMDL